MATHSYDLKQKVLRIVFDLSEQIAYLAIVQRSLDKAKTDLRALESHNASILGTINTLQGIQDEIDHLVQTKYALAIQSLEGYDI
jgi:hypothetical protein